MKYHEKHIEEHQEKLFSAHAQHNLCKNKTFLEELQSDERHQEWLNNPKYEYMRRQIQSWVIYLRKYRLDLAQKGVYVTEVVHYEKEGRNLGKKTDIIFVLSNGIHDPYSLKTLKKGTTIQTNASTFYSFILGFLFDKKTMYKFVYGNKQFTSRSIKTVAKILKEKGYDDDFIGLVIELQQLSKELKEFVTKNSNYFDMTVDGFTNYDKETGEETNLAWKQKCKTLGDKYKEVIYGLLVKAFEVEGINMVSRALLSQGIVGEHSTFIITPEKVIVKKHLNNIKVENVNMVFEIHGQGLRFHFSDEFGMNVTSTIPLTINKNGAWNLNRDRDNEYFTVDKQKVAYGYRRPVKSSQIATSTNTYINIA